MNNSLLAVTTCSLLITFVARRNYPILVSVTTLTPQTLQAKMVVRGSLGAKPFFCAGLAGILSSVIGAYVYLEHANVWMSQCALIQAMVCGVYAVLFRPQYDKRCISDAWVHWTNKVWRGDPYANQYWLVALIMLMTSFYFA